MSMRKKYNKDGGIKIKGRKISEQMLKITNHMSRLCYWMKADQMQLEVML